MATIKYINDDIDSDILNLKLAENYLSYLDSRTFGKSYLDSRTFDKNKWAEAYKNVMNAGITGISADGGRYSLQHNGSAFEDPDGYYGDVAYYIINTAREIDEANKAKIKEEEEKKKNLTPYRFDGSPEGFTNYILNNLYGGNKDIFNEKWTELDEPDLYGLRGTTKRRVELARQLRLYRDQLDGSKYSFEGTPFKDINDLKNRINEAITELEDPNDNDYSALRALGIDDSRWLNTNKENADLAKKEAEEQLKAKQAEELLKLQAQKANQYKNFRFFKVDRFNGTPPQGEDALKKLNSYYNLPKLNTQQWSELIGAFKYAGRYNMLENLSREELSKFGSTYSNNPTRLKKIRGLNGFYLDTVGNRIILPFMGEAPKPNILDIINENSPEALKLKLLNTPRGRGNELTEQDYIDIGATLADLGALITPGILSGTILSMGAAAARTYNRDWTNGNFWDNVWESAKDLGTGALGGTPLLGDASSLYKFARGFGLLMLIPAVWNAFTSTDEAKQALSKLKFDSVDNLVSSLKTLTPNDFHAISNVLVGIIGGKNHFKGNLAEREVIKHSGYTPEQINSSKGKIRQYAENFGVVRTKVPNGITSTKIPTIKAKVNDKDLEIELNSAAKSKLDEEIKKAGNNEAKRNEAVSKVLKDENVMGKGKALKESDVITVEKPGRIDGSIFGLRAPARFRTAKNLFGEKTNESQIVRENDKFDEWLNNRSEWNKWKFGTNKNLKAIRERLGLSQPPKEVDESKSNKENSSYPLLENSPLKPAEPVINIKKPIYENKNLDPFSEEAKAYRQMLKEKYSGNPLIDNKSITVGDNIFLVVKQKDGTWSVQMASKDLSKNYVKHGLKTLKEIQDYMSKMIQDLRRNSSSSKSGKRMSAKEVGKLLREFKAKGWLKHGGRLDKLKIQIYKNLIK